MYDISGLIYLPNYISEEHHSWLINQIDQETWDTSLKRRVQHYGYRYDYKARQVTADLYLGDLPPWLGRIAQQLSADGLIEIPPDQVIINEYLPGQGISPHIDCQPCFGERIFSLSLASAAVMQFQQKEKERVTIPLAPRSLVMMSGEARHEWKHSIPGRKSDDGVKRERRISLTFRKVTLKNESITKIIINERTPQNGI